MNEIICRVFLRIIGQIGFEKVYGPGRVILIPGQLRQIPQRIPWPDPVCTAFFSLRPRPSAARA